MKKLLKQAPVIILLVLGVTTIAYGALLRPNVPGGVLTPIILDNMVITAGSPFTVTGSSSSVIYGNGATSTIGGGLYVKGNLGIGTSTILASLHIDTTSSTLRIGSASNLTACIEMQDMSTTTQLINYLYASSSTFIATTTKPTFCK